MALRLFATAFFLTPAIVYAAFFLKKKNTSLLSSRFCVGEVDEFLAEHTLVSDGLVG